MLYHRALRRLGLGLLALACIAQAAPSAAQGKKKDGGPRGEVVQVNFDVPAGSIVIVNSERRLYYVTSKGEAVRYPIAVGKQEELWMGRSFVSAKVVNPKWIPVDGSDPVEGGDPKNPLGKRALYLDWSLLRIHGTPSRGSIGSAVSNGCIRMLDEHVMDLFERVHMGAPVFAARTREEVGTYKTTRIAQKFYADPAARRSAKEDQRQAQAEQQRVQRRNARAQAGPVVVAAAPRTPVPWASPYALGSRVRYVRY